MRVTMGFVPWITAQNKTANSTSITGTASASRPVGGWVVIVVAKDNTSNGVQTTEMSVTDSVGNVYTRVAEMSTALGAQNGSTVGMFYAVVRNAIVSGSTTVTVTLGGTSSNNDAQCFMGLGGTKQTPDVLLRQVATASVLSSDNPNPLDLTVDALDANSQHALVHVIAYEAPYGDLSWGPDTAQGFNSSIDSMLGTTGGGAASNQGLIVSTATRAAGPTSVTHDPTGISRDGAQILAAFYSNPMPAPVQLRQATHRATVY